MGGKHMLKYHVLVPAAIVAILLVVGVPFGTAVAVGIMTGCVSMVLMMGGGAGKRPEHANRDHTDRPLRR